VRTIATFAVAIFLGIIAVFLTRSYVSNATLGNAVPAAASTVPIVVATQDLDRGVSLQPTFLKLVNYPADAAPANAFHAIADLAGGKDQQRLVLRSMVANEPVLGANVSGPGGKLNLSSTVGAGMRAVSLRSSDVTGVGGFVLPGDRVDVFLTRAGGEHGSQTLTQVLAENVRVLGVDQSANDEADKPVVSRAITVEVTPDQAQAISLAQSVGTVSLTLRRVADDAPLTRKSTTVSDLGPTPHRVAGPPAGPAIRVVRGTDASRFNFNVASGLEHAAAAAPAAVVAP
jgi:pilus assembly protein CpaB